MQATTILLDVSGMLALAGGVVVAVGAQARARTADARRKALQARLEELEKSAGEGKGTKPVAAAEKSNGASDRRIKELEVALTRAEDDRRQLEARYEKRLKELTAAAAAASTPAATPETAAGARAPQPKSMSVTPAGAAAKATKEPTSLLFASGDSGAVTGVEAPLKAAGYTILSAATLPDVIRIARESKPGIIAVDVQLGKGGDGFKALAALKADETLRDIPVVLICALKDRDRAVEMGAAGCVAPPIAPNVLLGALNAAMVAHKKRAERSRMARAAASSAAASAATATLAGKD